jgi:tetratricopeptide (TPR) repeat protein
MFGFLKTSQWSFARVGNTGKAPAAWTLDRNWHRSEAERHLKSRNFTEALRHLAVAVEEADTRSAPPKQRVRFRLELADAQRRTAEENTKQLDSAEATVRGAIDIAAEAADGEEYVNCLDALADVFTDQKNFAALEKVEEQAIRRGAALPHPDPLRMAKRVHRLAVARHKLGCVEESAPALEKSIALHERTCGPESPEMAELLYEIGGIYRDQGETERAKDCLRRSLAIREKAGPDSPDALEVLQKLAGCYEDAGDLDGAAEQYERCLALKLAGKGLKNVEEVALLQYSLASLYAGWGHLGRARELLTECIDVFRREGGPREAVAHELLAQIEERTGRFHGADRELEFAAKVWDKCGPSRHPEMVRTLNYRADILDQLRRNREAVWLREAAATLEAELLGVGTSGLSSA